MPFRSVGGLKDTPTLQINSANAADMERVLRVRWDEEEDDENGGNQEVQEQENASPAPTMVGSRTREQPTLTPIHGFDDTTPVTPHASTAHNRLSSSNSTVHSRSLSSPLSPELYQDFEPDMAVQPSPPRTQVPPSQNSNHVTNDGTWNNDHCENSQTMRTHPRS